MWTLQTSWMTCLEIGGRHRPLVILLEMIYLVEGLSNQLFQESGEILRELLRCMEDLASQLLQSRWLILLMPYQVPSVEWD
jgi:hypothetical protein